MKTIETTYDPSIDGSVATGIVTVTGTDTEVQSLLNEVDKLKDKEIESSFIIGEYVRVSDDNVQEFSKIYDVKDGAVTVEDMEGKMIDMPMTSVQNMGERRALSLVGGRVPKDIEVGDLAVLEDGLTYMCNKTTTTYPFALVKGNGDEHTTIIARFEKGDEVILPHGIRNVVYGYAGNGMVITEDDGAQELYDESELEPWDPVTAVQRYAASFGMKVNVDVS